MCSHLKYLKLLQQKEVSAPGPGPNRQNAGVAGWRAWEHRVQVQAHDRDTRARALLPPGPAKGNPTRHSLRAGLPWSLPAAATPRTIRVHRVFRLLRVVDLCPHVSMAASKGGVCAARSTGRVGANTRAGTRRAATQPGPARPGPARKDIRPRSRSAWSRRWAGSAAWRAPCAWGSSSPGRSPPVPGRPQQRSGAGALKPRAPRRRCPP